MRILHVGFGFSPFRVGGLIEYAEDLMAAQVANGDTVGYFNAGRRYLWFRGPRLWRWRRGGVQVYELINSPLVLDEFGSKNPELDVSEPFTERVLRHTIAEFRPDVIHVQELASLPSSVLEIVQESGVPSLMTLQDYEPLCPTFRLYDYLGQICLQRNVGHKCVPCCATLAGAPGHILNLTWRYEIRRFLGRGLAAFVWRHKSSLRRVRAMLHRATSRPQTSSQVVAPAPEQSESGAAARAFQMRRDIAVTRLNAMDLLVAQSTRVAEIYRLLGVNAERLRTLNLTVNHLSSISFRARTAARSPVTFITLNGCASIEKGALLMRDAFHSVAAHTPANSFRLLIYGWLHPIARDLLELSQVEHRGTYDLHQLDGILDHADVGIVPSIWEEAYGYTGVEMLAKGLPIIGNRIGGIVDYLKPGFTGWLNTTNDAAGLAAIVRQIIAQPDEIISLNEQIGRARASIIKPMQTHESEVKQLYAEAARLRGASLAAA